MLDFSCLLFILFIVGCTNSVSIDENPDSNLRPTNDQIIDKPQGVFEACFSESPIKIDGMGDESIWQDQAWYGMNYRWMGEEADSLDYFGRFKLAWDAQHLYILVQVVDDSLSPTLRNGIENFWKGDYVEVFIDEDRSGGNHQFNHQAFAYHVSTEGHAIDQSTAQQPIFLDDHVQVKRTQNGNQYTWELAIAIYDEQFDESSSENIPLTLTANREIGFSVAYGDNDGNDTRENFMGSKETHGNNNDDGYIISDVLGHVKLMDCQTK